MIFVHFYRQQEEEANIEELQGSIALQNEAINALEQVRNSSIFQQTNPYLQIVIKLSPNTTFLKWYKGLTNTEEEIMVLCSVKNRKDFSMNYSNTVKPVYNDHTP